MLIFIWVIPLCIEQKIKSHLIDFNQIKSLNYNKFTEKSFF
jgi:hypothetical protein